LSERFRESEEKEEKGSRGGTYRILRERFLRAFGRGGNHTGRWGRKEIHSLFFRTCSTPEGRNVKVILDAKDSTRRGKRRENLSKRI